VRVEYTSALGNTFAETVVGKSIDEIKQQVRTKLSLLESYEATLGTITIGVFDPTDTTPAPSQTDIDREKWFTDYNKWLHIKALIDSGIITGTEPAVTTFKSQVQSDFKPSYLNYV